MDPVFADPRWTEFGLLIEAYGALDSVVEAERPPGLDGDLASVLIQLVRSPDEQLAMTQLARAMSLPPSRITRLVDRGEEAGYITRVPCPTDRRVHWAKLTDAGRAAVTATAQPMLDLLQRIYFDELDDRERATMKQVLRRLRDHAQERLCATGDPPSAGALRTGRQA